MTIVASANQRAELLESLLSTPEGSNAAPLTGGIVLNVGAGAHVTLVFGASTNNRVDQDKPRKAPAKRRPRQPAS